MLSSFTTLLKEKQKKKKKEKKKETNKQSCGTSCTVNRRIYKTRAVQIQIRKENKG